MRASLLVTFLCAAACATPSRSADKAACNLTAEDSAWLAKAPDAWSVVSRNVLRLRQPDPAVRFVLYDAGCMATGVDGKEWTYSAHPGAFALPDGDEIPAMLASFAAPMGDGSAMMVMALPSIWREDGVTSDIGLEGLMFAVFTHEMAHTRQFPLYDARLNALGEATGLGDDLTDDVVQDKFGDNAAFSNSIRHEIQLLYQAAEEPDVAAARLLAKQALDLIRLRRATFLTDSEPHLAELEDLFLTMEGAGQYAGFGWLSHASGGGLPRAQAIAGMRRGGKWWSQDEGLAIFLVLDRLTPGWPKAAFGSSPKTALALLAEAVHGVAH